MKLLIITPSTVRGGVEHYGLKIATTASQAGWKVHVAFPNTEGTHSLIEDVTKAGLDYHHLRVAEAAIPSLAAISKQYQTLGPILKQLIIPRIRFDGSKILHFFRTLFLLTKLKPDVVMINLPWPDFGMGSILACRVLKIPGLVVFQLAPRPLSFGKIKLKLYEWARQRQQWIGVSQSNCRCISQSFGIPLEEVSCIYNGATIKIPPNNDIPSIRRQARQALGLSEQTKIMLTVARLNGQKGHDFLIPAIPHLVKEFPDLKFVWVGDGDKKPCLLSLLKEYKITDQVLLLGYRSDIPELLQAADLFVFPTYYEGQPFALLEAMAYGLPAIATATDGIPEVMEHQVHGLLTRKGDACDLMEAIRWALNHPDNMRLMAENAKRKVQDFSQEKMLAQTLALLSGMASH